MAGAARGPWGSRGWCGGWGGSALFPLSFWGKETGGEAKQPLGKESLQRKGKKKQEKGGKKREEKEAGQGGKGGPYLHGDDPQLLGGQFPHLRRHHLRFLQDGELRLGGSQPAQQRQAHEAQRPPAPGG